MYLACGTIRYHMQLPGGWNVIIPMGISMKHFPKVWSSSQGEQSTDQTLPLHVNGRIAVTQDQPFRLNMGEQVWL